MASLSNEIQEYALDENGKTIHIDDIPGEKNGIKCNCRCICCGEELIARKGRGGRRPHFAHQRDLPCAHSEYLKQSTIHAMAEEIFSQKKEIELRPIGLRTGNYEAIFFAGGKLRIDKVELEKRISNFIPDIVITTEQCVLLVEIYVTHAVDDEKRKKIAEAGVPAIEINLSDYARQNLSKEELRPLLNDISRSRWIFLREAAHAIANFEKSKQVFNRDADGKVYDCPKRRFGEPLANNMCDKCMFCVGLPQGKVECIYDFCRSNKYSFCPFNKHYGPYYGRRILQFVNFPYPTLVSIDKSQYIRYSRRGYSKRL